MPLRVPEGFEAGLYVPSGPSSPLQETSGAPRCLRTLKTYAVQPGQEVALVESMKLLIAVPAGADGKVRALAAQPDTVIHEGETLLELD